MFSCTDNPFFFLNFWTNYDFLSINFTEITNDYLKIIIFFLRYCQLPISPLLSTLLNIRIFLLLRPVSEVSRKLNCQKNVFKMFTLKQYFLVCLRVFFSGKRTNNSFLTVLKRFIQTLLMRFKNVSWSEGSLYT
jgi:competence CoiA-like predicted nuclease